MITNRRYHIRRRNVSENLCGLNLKKLRSQNCQKMAKIGPFFSFPEKKYLLKYSHMPKNASIIIRFTLSQMDKSLGGKKCWKMVKHWLQLAEEWLELWIQFFCVCGWVSIEATNWSRHFEWVWWGMSEHAQSSFKWVSNITRMSWSIKLSFWM